jgi:hypothetical protein
MSNCFLFFALLTITLTAGCAQRSATARAAGRGEPADLVVVNAKVWTGDPAVPEATAFAVRDGCFVAVGDASAVQEWIGAGTRRIDAAGARIIPGIIDAHVHVVSGGLQLARLNLRQAPDRSAFIEAVARRAQASAPGQWLLGGRWSTESWPDPTQPVKQWIDPITPDHPVLLTRMDGHSALANSVALKLAGIDREGPPNPPGGRIDRDRASNEPTGILREAAMDLVSRHIPAPGPAELTEALAAATREAHRHGVTCVHTMSPWDRLEVLGEARDQGTLRLRVRVHIEEEDWAGFMERAGRFENDDLLRVVGFKQFMDGSLGSRTAYMAEPFADNRPGRPDEGGAGAPAAVRSGRWRGILTAAASKEGEIQRLCRAADAAGFNTAIHAIGDQANHLLLAIYEAVGRENGPRADRRLRIEHAQHLLPADIGRFAKLGVVASMQPYHKADDGRYAERAIGARRCRTSYAFRDLLNAGAALAFGSDWPVVTINPFKGIHAAVTGKTLDGKTFVAEQNISVEQALGAYTAGAAYAAGDEERLGRIKPGLLADFVILEQDVLAVTPEALGDVGVRETFVGGERVWAAE